MSMLTMNLKTTNIQLKSFIGQSYFNNDGEQFYLIFEPISKTITTISGLPDTIS